MSNIEAFEHRLAKALDRIAAGLDAQPEDPAPTAETATSEEVVSLRATLDEAADQINALQDKLDAKTQAGNALQQKLDDADAAQAKRDTTADENIAELKGQLAQMDDALTRQRTASAEMRDALSALRTAVQEDAPDADMINRAMLAELDALAADRAADSAEIDTILETLKPMLTKGASNAAS